MTTMTTFVESGGGYCDLMALTHHNRSVPVPIKVMKTFADRTVASAKFTDLLASGLKIGVLAGAAVLGAAASVVRAVANFLAQIYLTQQITTWTSKEKGKYFWERHDWKVLLPTTTLTVANVISFMNLLHDDLKLINLGRACLPLNLILSACLVVSCTFDSLDHAIKLFKGNRYEKKEQYWQERLEAIQKAGGNTPTDKDHEAIKIWKSIAQEKIAKIQTKLGQNHEKVEHWKALKNLNDVSKIKTICKLRELKWQARKENQDLEKARHWTTIAYEVTLIALLVLAVVLPIVFSAGAAIPFILAGFGLAQAGLDVTNYFAHEYFKPTRVFSISRQEELSFVEKPALNLVPA